jgi:pilus assembly protein CpaF
MSEWLDASLVADVRKTLLDKPGPVTTAAVAEAVQRTGRVLGSAALLELVTRLSAQLSGAGPLQAVLEVPGTTDVFVNGPREIFSDTGDGPRLLDLSLGAEDEVRSLAVRLAALGGRRLDDASPYVDVRLPDGVRMNAIVPPISGETTTISFRVPKRSGFPFAQLCAEGFVPDEVSPLLAEAVTVAGEHPHLRAARERARRPSSVLCSRSSRPFSASSSSRTPANSSSPIPMSLQLAARQANVEGGGEVTLADLVRNALRMRPDRLVVGECRGAEVQGHAHRAQHRPRRRVRDDPREHRRRRAQPDCLTRCAGGNEPGGRVFAVLHGHRPRRPPAPIRVRPGRDRTGDPDPDRCRWGSDGTGVGAALALGRRDRQPARPGTVRGRARAEVSRMTVLIAVLVAAGIILAAPSAPGARLRELLRRSEGAETDRRSLRRLRRRGGSAEESQADRLWAIAAVENCAHLLKVGMTPQAVMTTLSRQNEALVPISRAISLGEEPGRAIATRSAELPAPAAEVLTGMAAVWTVSERSGAPAAEMILRYAAAQRDALDAERERRIAMAGPKSTVRVLSWLPLIGIGLGLLIGVEPTDLATGLPGQLSIGGGVALYVLGRWWMRTMMLRAQR